MATNNVSFQENNYFTELIWQGHDIRLTFIIYLYRHQVSNMYYFLDDFLFFIKKTFLYNVTRKKFL